MEIKLNVDEISGKITQMSFAGDVDIVAVQKALEVIKTSMGKTAVASPSGPSVMAGDIADLSQDKPTIKERLSLFLKFEFGNEWFTSQIVKERYERQYSEEIKLSTVSTYLTRLTSEGFLDKRGNRVERAYHVKSLEKPETALNGVSDAVLKQ